MTRGWHRRGTPAELAHLKRLHKTMSERVRGVPLSPEHRLAISRGKTGVPGHAATAKQLDMMRGNTFRRDAPAKGECVYCGDPATEHDHVIPGDDEIVLSCLRCNSSKRKRTPDEWLADGLVGKNL